MRIVICAAFYPPYRGGYAESVRLLAEGLADRGDTVTVIACDADGAAREGVTGGVSVRRVRSWNPRFLHDSFPLPDPFAFWSALRLATREGADVISTQTRFFPSTLLGFLFAKLRGIPVVHTERGSAYADSENILVRACARIVDGTAGRLVCRFSDGVVGVSAAASSFARRLGARSPVTVCNGIDAGRWRRFAEPARTAAFPHIVFTGRLVHAKGVQDLLAATSLLLPEFPNVSVSVIGDGPGRAALERQARGLGLGRAAVFRGALDPDGVRDILWQADMSANPSYSEGFPRAVLEAAAVGIPTVATDVGGTREIIESGVNGLLVPPRAPSALADALRALARDGALRLRMGNAAAARSGDFSITAMVAGHKRVNGLCAASRA